MGEVRFQRASELGLEELSVLLGDAFTGYAVPIPFSVSLVLHIIWTSAADLTVSQILRRDGKAVGISIICRRGDTVRLGPFGIVPEGRGQRLGGVLLDRIIEDAQARGDRRMRLEVIEGNESAIRLYESRGFRISRRLLGFTSPNVPSSAAPLEEVGIDEAAFAIHRFGFDNLPWPVTPASLLQLSLPNRAYKLGPSYAVMAPAPSGIQLRAVVTEPDYRRRGHAQKLIQAIAAGHPDQPWTIHPVWPEEFVEAFVAPLGFKRAPIAQMQMELTL